jgi:hypothetical protein
MPGKLKTAGLSLAIFATSFYLRLLALQQTPYANGWDGYFYINQVKALLVEGGMDVPDSSLVYPLLAGIQLIFDDYVLSFKVLGSLLAGIFSVSLFLLAKKWSGNERGAIIVGSLTLFSPHLTYFAAQYPKNLLGVILFLWLLHSLDSRSKFLAFILLIINFFGHRVTVVLSFITLLMHYVIGKFVRHTVFITMLFLIFFCVVGFLLPGILNLFDVDRLNGMFGSTPHFAPLSFVNTLGAESISAMWLAEIVTICVIFFISLIYAIILIRTKQTDNRLILLLMVLLLLIFPFFKWSVEGPAFRFALLFILLCPVLTIFFVGKLANGYLISGLCGFFVLLGFISYKSYRPLKHDPPYHVYNNMSTRVSSMNDTTSIELIIAHKSLAEYIVYATGVDAMSWIPEYEIDEGKLWRVAADVKDVQFRYYLSTDDLKFISRLSPSYAFVREDVWVKFIGKVKADGNDELLVELSTWRNPDKMRPDFLLKNKRR